MGSEVIEKRRSLLETLATKFELEPAKFLQVVKATVFDARATEEELIAFLAICNKYDLDPMRKEIYAFRQGDKIQPIVGIDGWASIVNRHPQFDGCEFEYGEKDGKLVSTTCVIYRKDRTRPTKVTEYVAECRRNTPPWNTMERRMMRHRSYIQGIRLAFGISGIMDPDEFEQMVETQVRVMPKQKPTLATLTEQIKSERVPEAEVQVPPAPAAAPAPVSVPGVIPPRRRKKEAPVAAQDEEVVFDESGEQVPASDAPEAPAVPAPADPKALLVEVNQLRSMVEHAVFLTVLKEVGGDTKMLSYGLGVDSLKNLRDALLKAIG